MVPELRSLAARIALCSFLPDSSIAETLEDDRVAKRVDELEECIKSEFEFVANLPTSVWVVLAEACGCPMYTLRSDTIAATHLAHGFLCRRVFSYVRGLPWTLC